MVNRRSLGDAINMTPEKVAFIQGQGPKSVPQVTNNKSGPSQETEKIIDLEAQEATTNAEELSPRRSSRKRQTTQAPEASEVLDQVLVPLTFRLQHRILQALKRAYLEQKLKHSKPDTIQDIGEEAIKDWLLRAGYLN
jgi:hypothetical protein